MDQPLRQSLRSSIRNRRNLAMQDIDTYSDVHRARDVDHAGINERLYQAFNELHALAQDFGKDFDAPSILVVGHQTDGGWKQLVLAPISPWLRHQSSDIGCCEHSGKQLDRCVSAHTAYLHAEPGS